MHLEADGASGRRTDPGRWRHPGRREPNGPARASGAGDGYGVFAGLDVQVDAWESSARVSAPEKPEGLMSGWWAGPRRGGEPAHACPGPSSLPRLGDLFACLPTWMALRIDVQRPDERRKRTRHLYRRLHTAAPPAACTARPGPGPGWC